MKKGATAGPSPPVNSIASSFSFSVRPCEPISALICPPPNNAIDPNLPRIWPSAILVNASAY